MVNETSITARRPNVLSTGETVQGYECLPYSFTQSPELLQVHELTTAYTAGLSELERLRWLDALGAAMETVPGFEISWGESTDIAISQSHDRNLSNAQALYTYTAAVSEAALRIQSVRIMDETVDNGISMIAANSLDRLSAVYRAQLAAHPDKPYLQTIANMVANYIKRFSEPDQPGYRQSLDHWFQLWEDFADKCPQDTEGKEVYYLQALAFGELGIGPQDLYVGKCLVPGIVKFYSETGQNDKAKQLEAHFKDIPQVEGEPELWFYDNMAAQAAIAGTVKAVAGNQRSNRRRGKNRRGKHHSLK